MGNKKEVISFPFDKVIDDFIMRLTAQIEAFPFFIKIAKENAKSSETSFLDYIKDIQSTVYDKDGKKHVEFLYEHRLKFIQMMHTYEIAMTSIDLIPSNTVVSLVCQYDAFIGDLIRTAYLTCPSLLNSCDKNIQLSDILKVNSIDDIKGLIIDKEVETVLRKSHIEQIQWLENKIGITLTKDLKVYSSFVELTERRNLLVHTKGVISKQYISICSGNGVDVKDLKVGDTLKTNTEYVNKGFDILYEMGVKLGNVLWRKLKAEDIDEADKHLNNICYNLMISNRYPLAYSLLSFATDTLKKHSNEMSFYFIINKALSQYLLGNKDECLKILDATDWSGTDILFKLANSVLREDFKKASELMVTIGANNSTINKGEYNLWPLFQVFRSTQDFKKAYYLVFGEEYVSSEELPTSLEKKIDKLFSNKEL